MEVRKVLATVVGVAQGSIGMLACILACILYFNLLDTQTMLNVPTELLVFFLGVFGFFSLLSGVFLIHEEQE